MHTRTQAIDNKVQSIATKLIEKKKVQSIVPIYSIDYFTFFCLCSITLRWCNCSQ